MPLKYFVLIIVLVIPGLSTGGERVTRILNVSPGVTETVVIETGMPVSLNAQFLNLDYFESKKCGNCLHIETIANGAKNQAASNYGVGFVSVSPEQGRISVEIFHDYDSPKKIEVIAEPLEGR